MFELGGVGFIDDAKQTLAAGGDVVGQEVDPVQAAQTQDRVSLPPRTVARVALVGCAEFSTQHLSEEVAISTSGLEEARVNALALVGDKIEHVVDKSRWREHLAVVDHSLA